VPLPTRLLGAWIPNRSRRPRPERKSVCKHWFRTNCTSNGLRVVRGLVFGVRTKRSFWSSNQTHCFRDSCDMNCILSLRLCARSRKSLSAKHSHGQFHCCKARATCVVEHVSGSSSFKLGREPEEEEFPPAFELSVDFKGKSSSELGRNRLQASDCPGRMERLALGLVW